MSPVYEENENLNWANVGRRVRSALAVLVSLAVLVGGGWFVYDKASDAIKTLTATEDYEGEGDEEIEIVVPQGASITQIGDILVSEEVVMSRDVFRDEARDRGVEFQAGRYKLKTHIPAATAVDMLVDPANKVELRVQIIEGLPMKVQFQKIEEQIDVPAADMQAAARNADAIGLPAWSGGEAEGFLFPETYSVAEPVDPTSILKRQVQQFNTVASELGLEEKAEALGVTPLEVLTVASIIEAEVNLPEYRPQVAAVIYNRLDKGMKLEMDSTVHYAVQRFDTVTTTPEERQTESVYNTYRHEGLPPGPINSPGREALNAALNPADSEALFFVTVNLETGETRFANTLEEHEANVKVFQQYCQANPGTC